MAESWTPSLSAREAAGRCRLSRGGYVHGEGATLQEAADDLVRRLLVQAMSLRSEQASASAPRGRASICAGSNSSTSSGRSLPAVVTSGTASFRTPPSSGVSA